MHRVAEGKHIHASGWLIDFSIWGESLQNVKTVPNFQNVTNIAVLSNVAILQCFLRNVKCCRVFINKKKKCEKVLQILQVLQSFIKKKK